MLRNPNHLYGAKDMLVPARLNLGEFILQKISSAPGKVALIDGITGESTTYGQSAQEAMNLAVSLTHLGLRKGQTVALCTENRFEFWSVVVGVACTGAVLTTFNPAYSDGEIRHVLKISKPSYIVLSPYAYKMHGKLFHSLPHIKGVILFGDQKINNVISYNDIAKSKDGVGDIIVDNKLARNVKYEEFECADVMGQSDTVFLLYSSGTTGLPKGVMLTHLNVIAQCSMPTSDDVEEMGLIITPWFHVMGLVGSLAGVARLRQAVFLAKFDVDLFLKTIEKFRIHSITVVPPIILAISKAEGQYDLSSVKMVHCGAAPLYKETEDLLKAKFPNMCGVFQGYGMTEAALVVTRNLYKKQDTLTSKKEGTVGMPVPGVIIKVVDLETRKPLGPHQPGEICAKGLIIMKGYIGKDRREDFDEEGFFKTGDIGYYDEDHYFYIVDRLKELIKYKGYQVAPAEIEALLIEHDGIRDAGVIGIPDKVAGEVPVAFVVRQQGQSVTEKEIQDYVAGKLSNPKHLRGGVRFVDAIPRNPSGKILRKTLREMTKFKKSKL